MQIESNGPQVSTVDGDTRRRVLSTKKKQIETLKSKKKKRQRLQIVNKFDGYEWVANDLDVCYRSQSCFLFYFVGGRYIYG